MRAIIIAAWSGSRIKSLMSDCPKSLVESHNIPLLKWRLNEARRIAIAAIPYELAWGEVDSAEDLMAYQEESTRRAIK